MTLTEIAAAARNMRLAWQHQLRNTVQLTDPPVVPQARSSWQHGQMSYQRASCAWLSVAQSVQEDPA